MATPLARVLLLAATLVACGRPSPPAHRLVCIGDSITFGTTRGGEPNNRDAVGGYVGRLAQRLGASVEVIGRGVGGATAAMWLATVEDPRGRVAMATLLSTGPPIAADPGARLVDAVLANDRPDAVLVFLGTNDLFFARELSDDEAVDRTVAGLHALYAAAAGGGRRALVATVLPTRRPIDGRRAALARRLHAELGEVVVPLGERFEAAGWQRLLADDVHPNAAGYDELAAILADELAARGIVASK
jgi:lysophospholipase L1-like esterase